MKSPVKMKSLALLFSGWVVIVSPAFAGLFTDEELPKKIQQLEAKVLKLEVVSRKLEEASRRLEETDRKLGETNRVLEETDRKLGEAYRKLEEAKKLSDETNKQQARAVLYLQAQIEAQIADTRVLRGHNEELVHDLQEAKQRQKDFYVDLDARLRIFETAAVVEAQAKEEARKLSDETNKQQARAMLNLQAQIEAQIADIRVFRGHNEELAHDLQEVKQQQKDFYVDLDARLRNVETAAVVEAQTQKDAINAENLAYERAHSLLAAKNYTKALPAIQEFIKQYPQSVRVLNAHYDLGEAYFQARDYKKSLVSFQRVVGSSSQNPKVVEAMFRSVDCQIALKDRDAAKGTLKKIVSNYPGTVAAEKARKRLASLK